jgi:hypothetical protein
MLLQHLLELADIMQVAGVAQFIRVEELAQARVAQGVGVQVANQVLVQPQQ